ncbi:MAG: BrnA antitoxin family protein [Terriglobales bacterium]
MKQRTRVSGIGRAAGRKNASKTSPRKTAGRKGVGGDIVRRKVGGKKDVANKSGGGKASGKIARGRTERRKIVSLKASGQGGWGIGHDRLAAPRPWRRPNKKRITLYLDADLLAWFKERAPKYQKEINRALRSVMREEKTDSGK